MPGRMYHRITLGFSITLYRGEYKHVLPPGVVPLTTALNIQAAIFHCLEDMRDPRLEGKVCSTARNNRLVSDSTQRRRSNNHCAYRRIILCVEDLPGVGSSSHLRPTAH
ncbi:hypothetical protein TNCV_4045271 [Trichonephila clavipes]|nr:hypothetical protein TNCV_4045271 [Trichonephila clavipes]